MILNFESGPNACWTCPLCIRIWNHIVNFNGSPVFFVARRRCHACMTFRRMWLSDSLCPNMYTNRAPSDWWTAAPFVFDFNPACHGSFLFLVSVSPDLQIGANICLPRSIAFYSLVCYIYSAIIEWETLADEYNTITTVRITKKLSAAKYSTRNPECHRTKTRLNSTRHTGYCNTRTCSRNVTLLRNPGFLYPSCFSSITTS